jgi:hypothetical protein
MKPLKSEAKYSRSSKSKADNFGGNLLSFAICFWIATAQLLPESDQNKKQLLTIEISPKPK